MMPQTVRSLGLTAALLCLTVSHLPAAKVLNRNYSFEPGKTLTIDTERCNITITGTDRSNIEIEASCAREIEATHKLEFIEKSGGLHIKSSVLDSVTDGFKTFGFLGIDFIKTGSSRQIEPLNLTISLPRRADIRVNNSRGKIEIGPIDGSLKLSNSRGPIELGGADGPVELYNSRGKISAEGLKSGGRIDNSRGDIHLENCRGEFSVRNSRGHTTINSLDGAVDGECARGNLNVDFARGPDRDCELNTSRGHLVVHMPRDVNASIEAHVSRGNLSSDLPFKYKNDNGGLIQAGNSGSASKISLNSSRGDIRIESGGI